jgi:Helix-turn-helix domain
MQSTAIAHLADVIDERDAATFLGIPVGVLESLRRRGTGPSYMRIGRVIRYQRAALIEFQKSCTVTSTTGREVER